MLDSAKVTRRQAIQSVATAALAPSIGAIAAAHAAPKKGSPERPPNILFIMADDLGYADLSCYGRRDYNTPVLDDLAASGLMLTNGYANSPVCSPTRTALIAGAYQYRFPVGLYEPLGTPPAAGLPNGIQTMPGLLRRLGYRTSLIGKWHLGYPPQSGPLDHGYDSFFGVHEGGADYFTHKLAVDGRQLGGLRDGEHLIHRQGYLTDLLGQRAVSEIAAAGSSDRPFFMSLHFTAPHWPWESETDDAVARQLKNSIHYNGGNIATYAA
jgi:arylsulfatase A-like enzyme